MSVQSISGATYWSALALRCLRREQEAEALFEQIRLFGLKLEGETPQIDYFATSLPTLLLFDQDLVAQQSRRARYLQAQACAGQRDPAKSRDLLETVLAEDPSDGSAVDLLRSLPTQELS